MSGFIIDTPAALRLARLITLKHALRLEAFGMKRRGPSAFSIIKKETGIKARSAKELLVLFEDWLEVEKRLAGLADGSSVVVATLAESGTVLMIRELTRRDPNPGFVLLDTGRRKTLKMV